MRYDIYMALTDGTPCYEKRNSLEGKVLRKMLPCELESQVIRISKDVVEFEDPSKTDDIEISANRVIEDEKSAYENGISLAASLCDKQIISCEEIVGFEKETNNFCYSSVEIIDNGENTMIISGTVMYKPGIADAKERLISAKVGTWIYNTDFIKKYKPLSDFYSSRLETANTFDFLKGIQTNLRNESYIKPEDYVTLTILGNDLTQMRLDNDGEIDNHFFSGTIEKRLSNFFQIKGEAAIFEDPNEIIRFLHDISDFTYIPVVCNSASYGIFKAKDFITNFSKDQLVKPKNKQKQKEKTKNQN